MTMRPSWGQKMERDDHIKELELMSGELYRQGRYAEAVTTLEQVVSLIESHRGLSDPSLGSPLNNLATVYERVGNEAYAENAFRRSLETMAGSERPFEIASTLHSLANLYFRQNRPREADEHLRAAWLALAPVTTSHPGLAGAIEGRLANRLLDQDRFAEALPHQEAALQFLEAAFGGHSEQVGTAQNNLAHVLMGLEREDDAERIFRASLATMLTVVPPDDERVRDTVDSLAKYYGRKGRVAEEIELLKRYIKQCSLRVPDSNPVLSEMLMELARAYRETGDYGSSENAYKRALSDQSDEERRAQGLNGLGMTYKAQGRYADAEALYRKALKTIRKVHHGPDSIHEAALLGNLADLLTSLERTEEASQLLNSALAIREREHGPDHLFVARTLHTLIRLQLSQGENSKDMVAKLRRSIRIKEKHLGPDHLEVAASVSLLATVLCNEGRFEEAAEAYLRTLEIRQKVLGDGHSDVGMSCHNVGIFYTDTGQLDEAELCLRKSLKIFERAHGSSHPNVALALNSLGNVLTKLGRLDEAQRLFDREETIPGWETIDVPVLFATDRQAGCAAGTFSSIQLDDTKKLGIGSIIVSAPKEMVLNRSSRFADGMGFLDRAGGEQTQAAMLRVLRTETFSTDAYLASLARARLARATRYPGQGFLFVHGFNNSFDEAVRRAAMLSFDLDFDGPAFVFSWASHSKAWRYRSDRQRARKAVPFLVEALQRIGRLLPEMRLNIIAHSTGGEIAVNAANLLWQERAKATPPRLGELVLAHADVKPRTLARTLPSLTALGLGVTSYCSMEDMAMSLSRWLRGDSERVGSHPVYLPGVDCIDVTGLGVNRDLNHNVFVRNPIVFGDIVRLLSSGTRPPGARSKHFAKIETLKGAHWVYTPAKHRDDQMESEDA